MEARSHGARSGWRRRTFHSGLPSRMTTRLISTLPRRSPRAQGLDFVELTMPDGAIISSAQWPARFGYKDEWVARVGSSGIQDAMLKEREELPEEEVELALVAVRVVSVGKTKAFSWPEGRSWTRTSWLLSNFPEGMRNAALSQPSARGFRPKS